MVKWTEEERETIRSVWEKVDIDEVGSQIIARTLIVYPWTERYFGRFGDIFTTTAILNNAKVAAHGKVVLNALDLAVKNMDDIKGTYSALSRLHYDKLKVDPDNFKVWTHTHTHTHTHRVNDAVSLFTADGRLHHHQHRLQTQGCSESSGPHDLAQVSVRCSRSFEQSVQIKPPNSKGGKTSPLLPVRCVCHLTRTK
uniref:Hemoglobin, beta adult 2 n=2 Tax=Nothobranchius TaxID=28779 RepID=A0A8C6L555_NOTFU